MKLQTITFAALIALSGTASANWFDGFNNGNGTGSNSTNGTANTGNAGSNYAPAAFAPVSAAQQQPNYEQLKAMWEAQRKQADAMLKRIESAQQQAAPKS